MIIISMSCALRCLSIEKLYRTKVFYRYRHLVEMSSFLSNWPEGGRVEINTRCNYQHMETKGRCVQARLMFSNNHLFGE